MIFSRPMRLSRAYSILMSASLLYSKDEPPDPNEVKRDDWVSYAAILFPKVKSAALALSEARNIALLSEKAQNPRVDKHFDRYMCLLQYRMRQHESFHRRFDACNLASLCGESAQCDQPEPTR